MTKNREVHPQIPGQNTLTSPTCFRTTKVTFAAQTPGVEKIKVTVTNTAGKLVYSSGYKSGSKLTWDLKSSSGNKVANGIYMYKIQATVADGTTQASGFKRLLVLR